MVPAHQCLDPENLAVGEPHDRLVVQLKLLHGQRVLQIGAKLESFDNTLVHRRLEDAVAALAVALGHVHRDVGIAQELRRLRRLDVLSNQADPNARPWKHILALDLDREVERSQDSRRGIGSVRRASHSVEQDSELVSSEACDGVTRADGDLQPAADLLQDLVPGRVTQSVVHGLEVVEVDEHDGDLVHAALRAHQGVLDSVGEQRTVGELRYRVVERLVSELLLESLALADVAAIEHDAANVLVVEEVGVLDLEPQGRAVLVTDRALDRMGLAVARAVDCDQLSEQRPVGLAQ